MIGEKGKSYRFIFVISFMFVVFTFITGCGKQAEDRSKQQAHTALDQLLSCTLQQADDIEAAIDEDLLKVTADSEIGLIQGSEALMDFFTEKFSDSMTDECIERLAMGRAIYKSVALAKNLNSDIKADKIELTERSGEKESFNFLVEVKTSEGEYAGSASGSITMEQVGAEWKAFQITLNMDDV